MFIKAILILNSTKQLGNLKVSKSPEKYIGPAII